ncbi:MAG: DNA cytosine methyltransferase [Syntrophobacteraceae bacterium]
MKNSFITVTDQFCGAGGSSIGATKAGAEVRLAMNHWKLAIETHNTNFPKVDHVCTDISATDPRRYPSTDILITSPECTNHSLAKGKPRQYYEKDVFGNILIDPAEERSRATMWDVPRFAEYHDYQIIVVENVVDAGKWRMWDAWIKAMHLLDYEHQVVYFNSMFAWPTPQSRDRMYTVFWKRGNKRPDLELRPRAYCSKCGNDIEAMQSWKKRTQWGRYKKQYVYRCPVCRQEVTPYYYAAFNAIDWSIQAERIGDRKRPLKPKTLERIRYGLETYGRKPLIVTGRYTSGVECRVKDAGEEPLPTQPGDASHAVVYPWLVETGYSHAGERRSASVIDPVMTQTTRLTLGITGFLSKQYSGDPGSKNVGLDAPAGTITTQDHHALLLAPSYVAEMYGQSKASGVDDPLMCVTAGGGHHALLSADAFLTYYYSSHDQVSGIREPVDTVTTRDRVGLVQALEKLTVDDLTFRMLQPHEIGKAMAFPGDYKVLGTSRDKVRQYGNAVTPPVMEMILKRCIETL